MNILFTVEFYCGKSGGGIQVQTRQIAEGLVRKGHDVTIATSRVPGGSDRANGVRIIDFSVAGSSVKGIKGEAERYKAFLVDGNFDVMVNFGANVWTSDLAFEVIDSISSKKILSTPGLSRLGRAAYDNYYRLTYVSAMSKYDRIVYTSANYRDKKFADKHQLGDKSVTIANGVSDDFFVPQAGFREQYGIDTPFLIITVANHFFAKGHSFVIEAFKKMNRSDTTLVIIGELPAVHSWYSCRPICKFKELFHRNLKVLSSVPNKLVISAYQQADLFLFGSQLEVAPLVMYESFASRTPFITTDVGNVKDHQDFLTIIKTLSEMATAANALLDDNIARSRIAEKAFVLCQKKHTWNKIVEEYDSLIVNL